VAQQRPRQSRRPSAAKSIIRAEVPKDTDPIYLQASFFCAAAAGQRLYPLDLFARLLIEGGVTEVDVPVQAGVRVILVVVVGCCVEWVAGWRYPCGGHWGTFPLVRASGVSGSAGPFSIYLFIISYLY
jgi:hypothetical protein